MIRDASGLLGSLGWQKARIEVRAFFVSATR